MRKRRIRSDKQAVKPSGMVLFFMDFQACLSAKCILKKENDRGRLNIREDVTEKA